MIRRLLTGCLLFAAIAATGAIDRAEARDGSVSAFAIGPRVGFGIDPDQIVFGGHVVIGGFHPAWTVSPIIEVGFGDDVTTISLDFDGYYHMRLTDTDWRPYVGGGIGITNYNFDLPPPFTDESQTEAGINIVFGSSIPVSPNAPMFAELRVGFGDIPDLHAMVGWNFALR